MSERDNTVGVPAFRATRIRRPAAPTSNRSACPPSSRGAWGLRKRARRSRGAWGLRKRARRGLPVLGSPNTGMGSTTWREALFVAGSAMPSWSRDAGGRALRRPTRGGSRRSSRCSARARATGLGILYVSMSASRRPRGWRSSPPSRNQTRARSPEPSGTRRKDP